MPPLPLGLRILVYAVGGALSGFLFLAEFALHTFVLVDVALLAAALIGCVGVVRRWRLLELWPVFLATALWLPLSVDAGVVALPRCDDVAAGVACLASARDVVTPFGLEVVTFATALVGIGLFIARELRGPRVTPR